MKKPFKETKFGQFLSKAKDVVVANGGDVADIAFTAATQGPVAAIGKTISLLKKDTSPEAKALLSELELKAMEFEKDMYALEIQDRESARNRQVEVAKSGQRDYLYLATGFTGLAAFTGIIVAAIFMPSLAENNLFIHIAGLVEGVTMSIFTYHFSSSRGSRDKQITIDRMAK